MLKKLLKLASALKSVSPSVALDIRKIALIVSDFAKSSDYAIISHKEDVLKLPSSYISNYPDHIDRMYDDLDESDQKIFDMLLKILGEPDSKKDSKTLTALIDDSREKSDVIMGHVSGSELQLLTEDVSPISSPYLLKIKKQLGLDRISYNYHSVNVQDMEEEDDEIIHYDSSITGSVPNTLYHGTCSKYLDKIFRFGLGNTDGGLKSNFQHSVQHDKLVFLTSELPFSKFYAYTCAGNTNSRAAIIEFDVSGLTDLFFPDWDVDNHSEKKMSETSGTTWEDLGTTQGKSVRKDLKYRGKSDTYSKHIGKFSFYGRIPASRIKSVVLSSGKDWVEVSKEDYFKLHNYIDIHDPEYQIPEDIEAFIEEMREMQEEEREDDL